MFQEFFNYFILKLVEELCASFALCFIPEYIQFCYRLFGFSSGHVILDLKLEINQEINSFKIQKTYFCELKTSILCVNLPKL